MLPRLSRLPRLPRLALVAAALTLLVSCGSDDPDESTDVPSREHGSSTASAPSGSADAPESADPTADEGDEGRVERAPFCTDLDPSEVGRLLGIDDATVITQAEPGEELTPAPGAAPTMSQTWSCTIGTTTGSSVAATWNLGSAEAKPKDARAVVAGVTGSLGPDSCTKLNDESLGGGTRGADCAGTTDQAGGTGFTAVVRAKVVGGALLECYLASTSPDDLDRLAKAAPQVCGLFLDEVTG